MDTATVAAKLVEHCRNHTERQGLKDLYADDAESIEAMANPSGDRVSRGRKAIEGKHDWWEQNFDVHGGEIDGPFVHDNRFAVIFRMDATEKASGQRMQMHEVGLYHVADGKIVKEEFFMAPPQG